MFGGPNILCGLCIVELKGQYDYCDYHVVN